MNVRVPISSPANTRNNRHAKVLPFHLDDRTAKIKKAVAETIKRYESTTVFPLTCRQRLAEIFQVSGINNVNVFVEKIGLSADTYYRIINNVPSQIDFETILAICVKLDLGLSIITELENLNRSRFPSGSLLHSAIVDLFSYYSSFSPDEKLMFINEVMLIDVERQQVKTKRK